MRDPYAVLGLAPDASDEAIRRAFRAEAKRLHPDLNPDNAEAQRSFQALTEAYALLSDPLARARWQAEQAEGPPGWGPLDEGAEIAGRLTLPLRSALTGGPESVILADGRRLAVTVPPGVEDGELLRLPGEGLAGDTLVEVALTSDPRFRRQGADLEGELPVSLDEALNGAVIAVETLEGPVALSVPPGSNSGTRLRLKGRGLPRRQGEGRGDHYLRLTVVLPAPPDPALAAFVKRWSAENPYNPRAKAAGEPGAGPA